MSFGAFTKSFPPYLCSVVALLASVGCRDRAPPPSPSRATAPVAPVAEMARPAASVPRSSMRNQLRGVRPLVVEARRAELDVGGMLIDFGTADQLKYTVAGWGNGWGERKVDSDGTTYTETRGRTLPVRLFLYRDAVAPRQIAVRVRSRGAPRPVAVTVGAELVGRARVGPAWTTLAFPMLRILPGPIEVTLLPEGPARTGLDVDWMWLGRSPDGAIPQVGPRVGPLTFGDGTRRALLAPTPRGYAFYLEVPRGGSLVFDYGGNPGTRFLVRARADRGPARVSFQVAAVPGRWQEAVVDLSPLAGRAIKLELITEDSVGAGWGEPEIMVPREEPASPAPVARKPARNLILLVMDTARADVFRAFNPKSRVRTPAFDRLAEQATVFTSAYANENWTKPSVATILSGLYPTTHGTKEDTDVLSPDVRLLSEHLRSRSFATAAFIANGYCSDKFGFKRGWDAYTNYIRENKPSQAEHVFGDALAWMTKHRGERFFLYLQTIDPHVPYNPPIEFSRLYFPEEYRGVVGPSLDGLEQLAIASNRKRMRPQDWVWIRALYDAEVTYHDTHMGRFLDAVAKLGILDDTLIVVTNDHGEELRDHGKLGHGHSLYEELVRAPLLIRYPSLFRPGQRIKEPVENVDLFPTIIETLGLESVSDVDGLSLLPMLEGRPPAVPSYAVSEFRDRHRSVRVGRWKLVASRTGVRSLFNIEFDPNEQNDQAKRAPIAGRMCEQHLAEFLASPAKTGRYREANVQQRRYRPGFVKQDPELRRQLEALGYFGGSQ
jgi:choline-sulfatase